MHGSWATVYFICDYLLRQSFFASLPLRLCVFAGFHIPDPGNTFPAKAQRRKGAKKLGDFLRRFR